MAFTKVSLTGTRDTIRAAFTRFNTLIDDLLSTDNAKGASQVGLEDSDGNWDAVNLETLATEIADDLTAPKALAGVFAENPATTTGLTWGYKGGKIRVDNVITTIAAGTVGLTDAQTAYIEIDTAGTVHKNTTGYTSGRIPIRTIVTLAGEIVTSTDTRAWFVTIATATTTVAGILETATNTEAVAKTATDKILVPSNIPSIMAAPGNFGETTPARGTVTQFRWAKGADRASATALTLGTDGNYFDITGTTAITSIATLRVGIMVCLHFDGILTFTHSVANLILPGGANITTAANDEAIMVEYATGQWRCISYSPASVTGTGAAVRATSPTFVTPALGTPASGTLTSCTGLPQAGTVGLLVTDGPTFDHVHLTSGQVGFPATAVPSADPNTLDEYEEGEFGGAGANGIITALTGSITCGTSYLGAYVKIGSAVTISIYAVVSEVSTPSSYTQFILPFTVATGAQHDGAQFTVAVSGVGFTASYLVGKANNTATTGTIYQIVDDATANILGAAGVSATDTFNIGGTYIAA